MRKPTKEELAIFNRAVNTAMDAHAKQQDRAGMPYILHSMGMASRASSITVATICVLHDVYEDCVRYTFAHLDATFPEVIARAVKLLTHDPLQYYAAYIMAIKEDPLAIEVKLLDLDDHLRPDRLARLSLNKRGHLIAKYSLARAWLLGTQVPILEPSELPHVRS